MSITRRIALGYAFFAVLFIAAEAAFGVGMIFVYGEAEKTRERSAQHIAVAEEIYVGVARAVANFRVDAVTMGTGQGESSGGHAAQAYDLIPPVDDLEKSAWDDSSRQLASDLRASLMDFGNQAEALDNVALAAPFSSANFDYEAFRDRAQKASTTAGESQAVALEIVTTTRDEAAARTRSDKSRMQSFQTAMLLLFAVGAVIALLFAFLQPRSIARRLRGVVDELSTAAAETLAVASQVSSGALQTATAVSEAATTIDEVRQTTLHTSEKASGVAESARNADGIAESGRTAVARASERMGGIHDQMAMLAESVASLTDQTEAASDIVATINDISEQSRLLSVNASIEAVKASEEGRGFGVVAEEIKHLSLQSKQGVISVRTVLNEIQKAMAAAVMSAEQSGRAIELGVDETRDLRDAIEALADSVGLAAQSAMQIEASAQQELVGMDQISDAMSSIDQASAQNAAGAGQLEEEAGHLRDLAWRLEHLISARGSNRGGSGDGFDADSGAGTARDSVE
jgi:hypothetical protein